MNRRGFLARMAGTALGVVAVDKLVAVGRTSLTEEGPYAFVTPHEGDVILANDKSLRSVNASGSTLHIRDQHGYPLRVRLERAAWK